MVFALDNWGTIGGQGTKSRAPQMCAYKSADLATAVRVEGYFNDVADLLIVGDCIYAFLDTGGTPQPYLFWVTSITGSGSAAVVDVNDGLALGTTNSD